VSQLLFDFPTVLSEPVRFIPVQLSLNQTSVGVTDDSDAFHFAPTADSKSAIQHFATANRPIYRDDFDLAE
jgi:hypothetical protein